MSKWIDVSDRLPDAGKIVLVSYPAYVDKHREQYVEGVGCAYLVTTATNKYWFMSDGTTFGNLGCAPVEPVAWMPLPMPFKVRHDEDLVTS